MLEDRSTEVVLYDRRGVLLVCEEGSTFGILQLDAPDKDRISFLIDYDETRLQLARWLVRGTTTHQWETDSRSEIIRQINRELYAREAMLGNWPEENIGGTL